MKRLALITAIIALPVAACQPVEPAPPCQDDYCRQARLMLLNAALGNWQNQMRPPQTVYFAPCDVYARIARQCN